MATHVSITEPENTFTTRTFSMTRSTGSLPMAMWMRRFSKDARDKGTSWIMSKWLSLLQPVLTMTGNIPLLPVLHAGIVLHHDHFR
jgi:hypothetical protein